VKNVSKMTYFVSSVTQNLAQFSSVQLGRPTGHGLGLVGSGCIEILRIFSGLGWVLGRKKFPEILKLVVYYVYSLCQTVRFVNLQLDSRNVSVK